MSPTKRDVSKKQLEWEKKQEEEVAKRKEKDAQKAQPDDEEQQVSVLAVPENWPDDIEYLTEPTWSDAITEEQRSKLTRRASEVETHCRVTSEQVARTPKACAITIITDEKHPARGQRGLFAAENLEPDQFIIIYQGHIHNNSLSDTDPRSDYDLSFDREIDLSIDAARSGNQSRCANDYRGIAERPNAEFRDCFIKVPCAKRVGGTRWERRVGIFVLSAGKAGKRKHGIKAGEEILLSYGKQFWESRRVMAQFRKDFEMLKIANAALDY